MKPLVHKPLEQALRAFRHAMATALLAEAKAHGSSVSHIDVLRYIAEHDAVSMKDIASYLHITPPSASTLIDTLVAKKLVKRSVATTDRRSVQITLAPAAHALFVSIHKHKHSVFDAMLSKLDTHDKDELARILIKTISA